MSTSNEIIPKYIEDKEFKEETKANSSTYGEPDNKILDILDTKDMLIEGEKNTIKKPFSKFDLMKLKLNNSFRKIVKGKRTLRVIIKSDYTLYPIDIPIDGKTVLFRNRRYKIDGYEHRLYELQGVSCIFVDINDARPLDLSHKHTNIAYDAREFCSIFDSKAIIELTSQTAEDEQLNKMLMLLIAGLIGTAAVIAILLGVIKPEWQVALLSLKDAAVATVQNTVVPNVIDKTITGV